MSINTTTVIYNMGLTERSVSGKNAGPLLKKPLVMYFLVPIVKCCNYMAVVVVVKIAKVITQLMRFKSV